MKTLYLFIASLFIITSLSAQNEVDALRYSQTFNGGTARYVAMGGAFGALGGDLSSTYNNPAGIGVFRTSQFAFTPNLVFNSTSSTYLENTTNDFRANFNFNNIGYVSSIVDNNNSGLVAVNWGFTLNRLNNFHYNKDIIGFNDNNSITDYFAENAYGKPITEMNSYSEFAAWDTYSIDSFDSINHIYQSALPNRGEYQRRTVKEQGSMTEGDFSLGINIENKFYWGATIGIVWAKYYNNVYHIETEDTSYSKINNFNYLEYEENLKVNGQGFNLKTGIIYKPIHFLRLGAAIHSPTYFSLDEIYSVSMKTSFDDVGTNEYKAPEMVGKYRFHTPGKFLGSLAFVIIKKAIISVDYEFLDYSWGEYKTSYLIEQNENIDKIYTTAHNLKVGAEYRFHNISFRAGAAYYSSPFETGVQDIDGYTLSYSGGLGFNYNDFFMDFAYLYQENNNEYYMYRGASKADISKISNKFMATFGFRF